MESHFRFRSIRPLLEPSDDATLRDLSEALRKSAARRAHLGSSEDTRDLDAGKPGGP